jgi:hypothetical protein
MQHPLTEGHDGGAADAAIRWDAQAVHELGVFILRYLRQHPSR